MRWIVWLVFEAVFFSLLLTGFGDWVGGWLITPFALFGAFLMFVAIVGMRHSWDMAGSVVKFFTPAPQPAGQPEQPTLGQEIRSAFVTVGAVTMNGLNALDTDIRTKQHELAAGVAAAQQQLNAKQAAVNAEAAQLKALAAKVPNAA